jgi:hypothetical protein
VLPDFVPPGTVRISRISINSVRRQNFDPNNFQVPLTEEDLGRDLIVEFSTCKEGQHTSAQTPVHPQTTGSEDRPGPMSSQANMAGPQSPRCK